MEKKKDHEHCGFSWYVSDNPNIFNPYNLSDRVSRKTWYENITYPDLINKRVEMKKLPKIQYPRDHIHIGPNALFTTLVCPECRKSRK